MIDVVVITGIRKLHPDSVPVVQMRVRQLCAQRVGGGRYDDSNAAKTMVFGGALGVDTVAIDAATIASPKGPPRRVLIVPFKLKDQPTEAQKKALFAHEIVELDLRRSVYAYLRRNDAMLKRAEGAASSLVIGFTDGREEGGTYYTIDRARRLGLPVEEVQVRRLG